MSLATRPDRQIVVLLYDVEFRIYEMLFDAIGDLVHTTHDNSSIEGGPLMPDEEAGIK